jgi:hypothetical protein
MAEIKKQDVQISARLTLTIDEEELLALDAIAGYGTDAFIKAFYTTMGQHYLQPHERGLRTFLESVRSCAGLAKDAKECREFMRQTNAARVAAQGGNHG